jgi:transcriptional regulator with XRE-family HTH domain
MPDGMKYISKAAEPGAEQKPTEPNDVLREARERAGLSQAALGEAVGVSASTVSRWETLYGAVPRSPQVRRKVRELLGVDPWPEVAE